VRLSAITVEDGGDVCRDCRTPSPAGYMIKHELWRDVWPTHDRELEALHAKHPLQTRHGDVRHFLLLCIPCLERRLGRPLREDDLLGYPTKEVPINRWLHAKFRAERAHGQTP